MAAVSAFNHDILPQASEEQAPIGPDVPPTLADGNPLWEFGFGLSYSPFDYPQLVHHDYCKPDTQVSVAIENRGERGGKEAIPVFVSDHYASVTPDKKRLSAFRKVALLLGGLK
jgi:beta-glucosidase